MKFPGIIQVILFSCFFSHSYAQDSAIVNNLLHRLEQLQSKESSVFPKGMFPSYRTYVLNKDQEKADVNAFYTGLICLTLRNLRPKLTISQQVITDSIIARAKPVYEKFKNRKGRPTYNFWPTDTVKIFPNSGLLNLFDKKQSLADDLDDTVIFLMALNVPDSIARYVHALMQEYTINPRKRIKKNYEEYRKIPAYSTWFGKKMPVGFDICVLSNVLYFVQRYQLQWTAADSASLRVIIKVINANKHLTDPSYVSPNYARSSVILYHLSRLMSLKSIAPLEALKSKLIADAIKLLQHSADFIEQNILQTALLRWGVKPPKIIFNTKKDLLELTENANMPFFIANMGSVMPSPWDEWLGSSIGKFYYHCEAYNDLLLLENILLNQGVE